MHLGVRRRAAALASRLAPIAIRAQRRTEDVKKPRDRYDHGAHKDTPFYDTNSLSIEPRTISPGISARRTHGVKRRPKWRPIQSRAAAVAST